MGARKKDVSYQSPGLAEDQSGAYQTQLNKIAKNDPAVYRALAAEPGDHIHHKAILKTLTPLFNNLSENEAAELRQHLNKFGGIGNHIFNLIPMPGKIHQGGIHPMAQGFGYEYHPNRKKQLGFVRDIMDASELPLAYRKHVGEQYLKQAVPDMNNYINDLLTAHYAGERLGISPTAMRDLAMRDQQAQGKIVGEKPLVVNAGPDSKVYVHTGGNGNGNGHAEMQKAFIQSNGMA